MLPEARAAWPGNAPKPGFWPGARPGRGTLATGFRLGAVQCFDAARASLSL
jgi:hypothetical protein